MPGKTCVVQTGDVCSQALPRDNYRHGLRPLISCFIYRVLTLFVLVELVFRP